MDNLIIYDNLLKYGFDNQGVVQVPYIEFKKKMSKKLLTKKIKGLAGRGKCLAFTLLLIYALHCSLFRNRANILTYVYFHKKWLNYLLEIIHLLPK